jgi:hypothetical protein
VSNTVKAGRRERLLARKRPTFDYQLAVVEDADAVAELSAAKEAFDTAEYRADEGAEQAVTEAEARLEKARKAVEACYEPVTLTAMPPTDFEALLAKPEYAARDGKDERWNADTFPRAVFLTCVEDEALTAEEWVAFTDGSLSQGERESLFMAAVALNARWPSGAVPNV